MPNTTEKVNTYTPPISILCDGCEQPHSTIQTGEAAMRDGATKYLALCIGCRLMIRANEADNISHFRPNA